MTKIYNIVLYVTVFAMIYLGLGFLELGYNMLDFQILWEYDRSLAIVTPWVMLILTGSLVHLLSIYVQEMWHENRRKLLLSIATVILAVVAYITTKSFLI